MDDLPSSTLARTTAEVDGRIARRSRAGGPRLLVSVRSSSEAVAALSGGADLIDVKEPFRGPLGMAEVGTIAQIIETVTGSSPATPVSAALGETIDWASGTSFPELPQGLGFVKLGLHGLRRRPEWRTIWLDVRRRFEDACDRPLPWIAVAYADAAQAQSPPVEEIFEAAQRTGCQGLLIDTWGKQGPGLTGLFDHDELAAIVRQAQQAGLLIALAGRLRLDDVAQVAATRPDVIAVRSAACAGGDREQSITADRVQALRNSLHFQPTDLPDRTAAATACIRERWPRRPHDGIILGTGLGRIVDEVVAEATFEYDEVPHFPCSTATSHAGRLTCGLLRGRPVIVMQGRCHLYEGYTAAEITLPVRVMHQLGVRRLIVSNAAGGLNPRLAVGDLVLIDDHINLTFARPATSPTDSERHPLNVGAVYDEELIAAAERTAAHEGFAAHRGTYAAVSGPNYETRAEYRLFRRIGADVIGMSTVPEAAVAAELGLRVLAISTVTNVCNPDELTETDGASVAAAAATAEWKLRRIILSLIADES